ncbi:Uncharacterised protein [Serratia rubidaea]|uniref:HTH lacI-type domain-containing protein n=1 Tax=Serratia rubidaea TaxID=61652 RepID=A0A4U9HQ05_SERRU|nr:Uncharacterised protein [Serratia rubidaea]
MNGKLKVQEIARQTGLSISTVSRVLAGKANTSSSARQKYWSAPSATAFCRRFPADG